MQCSTWGSVDNPSSTTATDDFSDPDSPIESFVMDDDCSNYNMSEEEDDEYFIFAGIGNADFSLRKNSKGNKKPT